MAKRRLPRGVENAHDGPHGRPAAEILHRWISREKRRTHKRERREARNDLRR
jgi:hypothetical protein